jgi:hypothetical protein
MQLATIQSTQPSYAPVMFEKGGQINTKEYGLASAAEELRKRGRYGDTVLAHINPEEAGILKLLGGAGTINPHTGLPEFFFKSLFKGISNIGKSIGNILKPVAKVAPFILPFIPGIGLPMRALLSAGIGGLSGGKGFDLKRALFSGLSTYGIGSLMNAASAANAANAANAATGFGDAADQVGGALSGSYVPSGAPIPAPDISIAPISAAGADISTMPVSDTVSAAQLGPDVLNNLPAEATAAGPAAPVGPAPITSVEGTGLPGLTPGAAGPAPTTAQSIANLAGAVGDRTVDAILKNPIQAASLATTAYGAIKSKEELDRQKKEADRILQNREREKAEDVAQAQQFLQDYPLLYQRLTAEDVKKMNMASGGIASYDDEPGMDYAGGGLAYLANGGMPPRYLRGGGDGMSDSIPARIGGKQEARLADGEFVVPADVVSHIGNGSSNAGAKKLYAMMDRARQARTGRTRQAPAVKAERYMPA